MLDIHKKDGSLLQVFTSLHAAILVPIPSLHHAYALIDNPGRGIVLTYMVGFGFGFCFDFITDETQCCSRGGSRQLDSQFHLGRVVDTGIVVSLMNKHR